MSWSRTYPVELPGQVHAELLLAALVRGDRVVLQPVEQAVLGEPVDLDVLRPDRDRVVGGERGEEAVQVPVGGDDLLAREPVHLVDQQLGDPVAGLLGEVGALEHLAPLGVDDLALLVEDVVVLQHPLADVEVLLLDLLLRALDRLAEALGLDGQVVARPQQVEDLVDAVTREDPDQVVLGGQVEARAAGVALAPGAAAQLVVDAAALVALGADHVEPAEVRHAVAQLDVHAAPGHVGGDGHRAALAGVLDDLGHLSEMPTARQLKATSVNGKPLHKTRRRIVGKSET